MSNQHSLLNGPTFLSGCPNQLGDGNKILISFLYGHSTYVIEITLSLGHLTDGFKNTVPGMASHRDIEKSPCKSNILQIHKYRDWGGGSLGKGTYGIHMMEGESWLLQVVL